MQYIVYCSDPDNLVAHEVRDPGREQRPVTIQAKWSQDKYSLENSEIDIGTFLVSNKEAALRVADWMAKKRPGWDIYIAKTENVVSALVPATVVKTVNEQGVLPT